MKELSIEEKAKRYDEALSKAKEQYDNYSNPVLLEYIFPELKESEDERIRKWLIEMVEEVRKVNPTKAEHNGLCSEAIAWLEKQGEQKSAELFYSNGLEEEIEVWVGEKAFPEGTKITPLPEAIKIVRETALHFQKWEAARHIDGRSQKEQLEAKQNLTWSEEDEKFFKTALWHISNSISNGKSTDTHCDTTDWLKNLKDRVGCGINCTTSKEWSEEDKERIEQICSDLKCGMINFYANEVVKGLHHKEIIESNIDWLKSLRPQNRWKPSEEQMKVLQWCMPLWYEPKSKAILESLINDLKKLRVE